MLKEKECRMVLDYLYQECLDASHVHSEILKRTGCMLEAKMKYENMSSKEKVAIYAKLLDKKIINYLIDSLNHSLVLDWVNGSPQKRAMRIHEYARNQCNSLSKAEKIAICEKIGLRYMS